MTNLDTVTVNTNPTFDNEVSKKCNDDELGKNSILGFSQTLQNYLKVSVGNDVYNLNKYDEVQVTDPTNTKSRNTGRYFSQNRIIKCNDKYGNGKRSNFMKSTKTNSPTSHSGARSLPPIDDSFMYIETSSGNHGDIVLVSFKRTDIIQFSKITFDHNRFSM